MAGKSTYRCTQCGYSCDHYKGRGFFGQKISKRERLTNWEADILMDKQKQYAATDAWACIMLYEELMRLEETGDYELIKIADDVQADSVTERKG